MVANERLDYGLDAPGFPRMFGILAVATAAAAILLGVFGFVIFSIIIGFICAVWTFLAAFWILGCKYGKLRARDIILSRIEWRGDEHVLDIGCGHGLLLVGAAKKLTTGRAIGIDIWSQVDQLDNHPENTARNARIEGVADRVEIRDGDARKLNFPDAHFDVVLSASCLHNIRDKAESDHAIREIIRILKPGGQVAIYDMQPVFEYRQIFLESGMEQTQLSGFLRWYLPGARLLTAVKPKGSNP
jgi:arsenite methyltransferase